MYTKANEKASAIGSELILFVSSKLRQVWYSRVQNCTDFELKKSFLYIKHIKICDGGTVKVASVVIFYGSCAIGDSKATVPRDKRKRISKVKTVLWTVLRESVDQTYVTRCRSQGEATFCHLI